MIKPISWADDEALAIRALLRDEAHTKAVQLILFKACGIRDLCFQSEKDGGQWETAFHLGRRAVGLAIAQLGEETVGKSIAKRVQAKEAPE